MRGLTLYQAIVDPDRGWHGGSEPLDQAADRLSARRWLLEHLAAVLSSHGNGLAGSSLWRRHATRKVSAATSSTASAAIRTEGSGRPRGSGARRAARR